MTNKLAGIFYHVPNKLEKQKIIVDYNSDFGAIQFPELSLEQVEVENLREYDHSLVFEKDSLEFFSHKTNVVSFKQEGFRTIYDKEIACLLKEKLHVKEAIVFDHSLREELSIKRAPARHAHIDYTQNSALEQVQKHVSEQERQEWLSGHFAIINLWRPVDETVTSAPMGFILPQSLVRDDLIEIDLIYPQRKGEVTGCLYNNKHRWVYMKEMTPDEVVVFNMYDNSGRSAVVHSAIDFEKSSKTHKRKSIESRVLVKY